MPHQMALTAVSLCPWWVTLGSEAKKKKATKTSWWQWGGRAEKNLRFKPASCTTVDKVSCVHKEFTGIISSDILVNVQQLIFQKQKDLTVALAYFHIPTMAEFKPPLV